MLYGSIQRQVNITLDLIIHPGEQNINRLIKETEVAAREVGCQMLKAVIGFFEELAIAELEPGRYRNKGSRMRTIQTGLGRLEIALRRYKDKVTGEHIFPLKQYINLPSYVRYMPWVMQDAVGLLPQVSFRGSSREVVRIKGESPSKSTIHRRLAESLDPAALFQLDFRKVPYRFLIADGTKIRLQEEDEKTGRYSKEGSLRWAYAARGIGERFDLVGMWVNKSWEDCAQDLYQRLNTKRLELLLSDQEQGLKEAFLLPHMRHQPCLWHVKRDLSFMLYGDGLKKAQQEKIKDFFNDIALAQPLDQAELFQLLGTDKPELETMFKKTSEQIRHLVTLLDALDLKKTKTYVENLASHLLTFLDIIIQKEELIPVWSSMVESKFSLIKNRIRNIGKRWSDEGLLRWLAVAVRKMLPQFSWDKIWEKVLGPCNFELKVTQCWIS